MRERIFAKQKFKPHEILLEMNNDLKETNPVGTFVTSIVGRYNLKSDLVEIANAGHQPALLRNGKEFKEFPSSSVPLAITKHKDESVYKLESFNLNGGRIYCFTDGFSECMNEKKEEITGSQIQLVILRAKKRKFFISECRDFHFLLI